MIRIGIIGTENSHAMAFSKIINLPDDSTGKRKYEDLRIVGVYGPDRKSAEEIAEVCGVDFIAKCPEDFLGRVDAMMITCRKGSLHAGYALPFVERRLPVFIDKPITSDPEETRALLTRAQALQVPVAGGSGCKMLDDVVELSATVDAALKTQTFHTAVLSYSADLACIYDGFYFYASHLIEIALCVFGYGVKGVRATEKNGNVTVLLRYDGFDISLLFTAQYNTPCCLLCVGQDHRYQELDLSNLYEREIESFAGMLRTGKMPFSYAQLAKPVYVIDAILESLRVDAEVSVSDETKRRN